MFLLGSEGAAFMLNSLEFAQQVWLNTGFDPNQQASHMEALVYDQTIKYRGGNFTPHKAFVSGSQLFERLHMASVIYVTYFHGSVFWPVYVGGANLPGPDEAIAAEPDTGSADPGRGQLLTTQRNTLTVRTRWRVGDTMPLKLFVHVFATAHSSASPTVMSGVTCTRSVFGSR
jgi:hypothetical protein